MSEDLGQKIDRLTETVHTGQTNVAGRLGELTATVDGLRGQHDRLAGRVEKVVVDQAGCPARAGLGGINARLRKLEARTEPKGEPTGSVDVSSGSGSQRRSSWMAAPVVSLLRPFLPWIIAALVGLGAWMASGGDSEKAMAAIAEVRAIQEQIEKRIEKIPTDQASRTAEDEAATWPTSDPSGRLVPISVLP